LVVHDGEYHALSNNELTGFDDVNEISWIFVLDKEGLASSVLDFFKVSDHFFLGWLREVLEHIAVF
jgi:hypothetical protein